MPNHQPLRPAPQIRNKLPKVLSLTKLHMRLYTRPSEKRRKQLPINTLTQTLVLVWLNTPSTNHSFGLSIRYLGCNGAESRELGTVFVLGVIGSEECVYALGYGHGKWVIASRLRSGKLDVEDCWVVARCKFLHDCGQKRLIAWGLFECSMVLDGFPFYIRSAKVQSDTTCAAIYRIRHKGLRTHSHLHGIWLLDLSAPVQGFDTGLFGNGTQG